MAKPTRKQVEDTARHYIGQSLGNFMPQNGQTYVNGSYSRRPHYDYEVEAVKAEARQNTIDALWNILGGNEE